MKKSWFPGLMAKEEKKIQNNLKLVDLVVEVLDARIPLISRNHRLQEMLGGEKRIVLLNKEDLAEEKITGRWVELLAKEKWPVLPFNAQKRSRVKQLEKLLKSSRPAKMKFRKSIRLMVAGIPNVGKSSVINRLTGKHAARTGREPGITRGRQWIRLRSGWEILDTPGVLPPSLEKDDEMLFLAAAGCISYRVVDIERTARWFLNRLVSLNCITPLLKYYSLEECRNITEDSLILQIGENRGCFTKGGKVDFEKTAQLILTDYNKGLLGRITLERPEGYEVD